MWRNLDKSHSEVKCDLNRTRIKDVGVYEAMDIDFVIVEKELKLKHRSAAWQKLRLSQLSAIIRPLFRYHSHFNLHFVQSLW